MRLHVKPFYADLDALGIGLVGHVDRIRLINSKTGEVYFDTDKAGLKRVDIMGYEYVDIKPDGTDSAHSRSQDAAKSWPNFLSMFSSALANKNLKELSQLTVRKNLFLMSGKETSFEWFRRMLPVWNSLRSALNSGFTQIEQGEDDLFRSTKKAPKLIFTFGDDSHWKFAGVL